MAEGLQHPDIGLSGSRKHSACSLGLGLGLGLGGPWVAQAWTKRGPRAMQGWRKGETEEVALFAAKGGKRPGGDKPFAADSRG